MEAIDEIVAEFLVESHENLDQLDRDLARPRAEPRLPRAARQHLPDDPHHQGHERLPGVRPAREADARRREPAQPAPGRPDRPHRRPFTRAARDGRRRPRPARRASSSTGGEGDADHGELIARSRPCSRTAPERARSAAGDARPGGRGAGRAAGGARRAAGGARRGRRPARRPAGRSGAAPRRGARAGRRHHAERRLARIEQQLGRRPQARHDPASSTARPTPAAVNEAPRGAGSGAADPSPTAPSGSTSTCSTP